MDSSNPWGGVDPNTLISSIGNPADALNAYQQSQQQSVARAFAIAQNQRQMQQQAIGDTALKTALADPSPQNLIKLSIARPDVWQSAKAAHDATDQDVQQQNLQDTSAVYGLLQSGNTDGAKAIVNNRIVAGQKAGRDVAGLQQLAQTIDTNPKAAQTLAGTFLAATVGPDKFADTFGKIGSEQRAQAGFPLEQQGKQADIALKGAQTTEALANANAKINPPAETAINPVTGAPYNPKAAPPAAAASSNNGALDGVVQQIIQSESGGNAVARNSASSATGAGQFLSGTWAPLIAKLYPELVEGKSPQEVLDLRNNPQLAAEATAAYAQDNAQALAQANLPVNGATIAMAHRLGPQGAQAVLGAQANAPLSSVLPADVIKANPQYANMTAGQLGQQLAGKFGTTGIDMNPGDPNATGEDFLRTLAPPRAALVKAIAEGLQPGPTGRSAASGPGAFLMQQVQQYDPTATPINLPTRQATRKAFTSGTQGQSIVQANTVGGHLAALDALADTLHNGNIPFANTVAQAVQTGLGDTSKQKAVTSFNTLSNTLASELTKFYRNNGGSEKDVEEFRRQLSPTNSPTQIHSAIAQMAGAVLSKVDALNTSYNQGMGKVTDGISLPNLNHNAIGQLQRLAGESGFGGGAQSAQANAPQVYVNPQTGQKIVYDAASKGWKAAS